MTTEAKVLPDVPTSVRLPVKSTEVIVSPFWRLQPDATVSADRAFAMVDSSVASAVPS